MRQFAVDPLLVDAILLTHLHGDHFGGIPFFVLDAQLISKRKAPLVVAGPPGLEERIRTAMEALFPGSTEIGRQFDLSFIELPEGRRLRLVASR
jgi:ribonuclease BN (tRNA processing enzyme)